MSRLPVVFILVVGACSTREPAPASLQAAVSSSRLPVLLPRDLPLERARLTTSDTFTALHLPLADGVTISLHQSRLAHRHAGVHAAGGTRTMRGRAGQVTVNEGIRTATWIEDGIAYALDVECASAADVRCADERFLLELVDSLGAP